MTGFNLPPGCSVSDIPGNSSAEMRAEAIYETIYAMLEKHGMDVSELATDNLAEAIYGLIEKAFAEGYNEGMTDQAAAKYYDRQAEGD